MSGSASHQQYSGAWSVVQYADVGTRFTEGPCHDLCGANAAFLPSDHDVQRYATEGYYDMGLPGMGGDSEALGLVGRSWLESTLPGPLDDPPGFGYGNYYGEETFNVVSPLPESPSVTTGTWTDLCLPSNSTHRDYGAPISPLESPAATAGPARYGDAAPNLRLLVGSRASAEAALRRRRDRGAPATKHRCFICNKTFTKTGNLKEHISRHEDKREHKCKVPGCTIRCNTRGGLRSHLNHRHRHDAQRPSPVPVAANNPFNDYFPAADAAMMAPVRRGNLAGRDWDYMGRNAA